MSTPVAAPGTSRDGRPWRAAAAAGIGSVLEFYDFFVYGPMAALVFAKIFFPGQSDEAGTLLSLSTFAVGFIARPLGGVIVGHFGDRLGRKRMLVATFFLTGFVTCAVGLLPTYAQIGIWAPVLLVTLRFLQGVGLGGEWGGAALLTVEHAPEGRRGFFGSLVQAGAPLGLIASNGVVAILTATLTESQMIAWGWRIPFLLSAVLLLVGMILRLGVEESPEFMRIETAGERSRLPVLEVLRRYPKQILAAIGVHVSDTTLGLMQGIFVLGFATHTLGISPTTALLANIAGSMAMFVVTPLAGQLSDRYGRRLVLAVGAGGLALYAFPMFWLIESRSIAGLFLAYVIGSIIVGTIYSPQATFFAELFEPRLRYTGMSLGFQIATVIGGGLGPIIAQALQNAAGGETWLVSTYLLLVALVALWSALAVRPAHAGVPSGGPSPSADRAKNTVADGAR